MCSVIDNQKEFKPCYFVVDQKFIDKKINGHFEYMVDVARSERKIERKKELILSSMGALISFLSSVDIDLPTSLRLAAGLISVHVQIAQQLSRPKPRHEVQGITNLGAMTEEVILKSGERVLPHPETKKFVSTIKMSEKDRKLINDFHDTRQMSLYKYFQTKNK